MYTMISTPGVRRGGQPAVHVSEGEVLHAATLYTMTSTPGVRRGGQPSVHVPEGKGTSLQPKCTQ